MSHGGRSSARGALTRAPERVIASQSVSVRGVLDTLKHSDHPLRLLVAVVLVKSRLSPLFRIRHQDFTVRFYPTGLSTALWIDPDCRRVDNDFLRRLLRPGDSIVDVGANIGSLTLTASAIVGETGKVFSIEAHPRTFEYLRRNIARNRRRNVVLIHAAVGDKDGTVRFSSMSADDQNSIVAEDAQGVDVRAARLDSLPTGDGLLALVKIDVEGYEGLVLAGAPRTLARARCLYLEVWETHFRRYGYSCVDVWRLLGELGFRVARFAAGGVLEAVERDYVALNCENVVAVRDSSWFRARTGLCWARDQPTHAASAVFSLGRKRS
jgi:FkbM family methyltransferase